MTQVEALKAIAARDGGLLRPQAVVDAARDEESPLHGAFCWDDTEAAEKYRLLQAQDLIRSFRVVQDTDNGPVKVSMFVNLSTDRTEGKANNVYRMLEDVKAYPDLMETVLNDALAELDSLRNKYAHLKELSDVWAAVDAATQKRRGRKAKA